MNIFVLDTDPECAAHFHNDRHVCKGILEAAKLLCAAHVMLDGNAIAKRNVPDLLGMKDVTMAHPCTAWVRGSSDAYDWLHTLMGALLYEYRERYGRAHQYGGTGPGMRLSLFGQLSKRPLLVPMGPRHPFAQAMPLQYRRSDPVRAYRLYYFHEKSHLATWRAPSETPQWWSELEETQMRQPRIAQGT